MGELGMLMIALAATGTAPQQVDTPTPPADRSRPAPDVYYPPLPPAPVQPVEEHAAPTASGAAHVSPPKPGCRKTQS